MALIHKYPINLLHDSSSHYPMVWLREERQCAAHNLLVLEQRSNHRQPLLSKATKMNSSILWKD